MSGILAILDREGGPVDPSLLTRLTRSMAYRGPDAREVRLLESVGMGHAMHVTTHEAKLEKQPGTLDGRVWICADARVDAREELRRKLEEEGRENLLVATDSELILHAYHVWGTACPQHLMGDFSFVIWDCERRRFLCARDQFGIKPLFYAVLDRELIVSNTFDTVRRHPGVSDELNETWVADSLLFPFNQDPGTSPFARIRRVPPAHVLLFEQGSLSESRYWTVPAEEPLRFRDDQDYIELFHEVLGAAVHDRLRTERVGINMSGGLDSTTIAATAVRVAKELERPCELKAFTGLFEPGVPDPERPWAEMAADSLGIPIRLTVSDGAGEDDPLVNRMGEEHCRAVASETRVLLTGFGGDPLNRGSSSCYNDLVKRGQFLHLARDVAKVVAAGKRPPLLVRTLWRNWQSKRRLLRAYPEWIDREFEKRLELRSRWRRLCGAEPVGWSARSEMSSPFWAELFAGFDPGSSRLLLEYRHPFFDLRVVGAMLRIPPLPWFMQKFLMRRAMEGSLPAALLARPKATFTGPSDSTLRRRPRDWWVEQLAVAPEIGRYVDAGRLLEAVDRYSRGGPLDPDSLLRPIALARWLRNSKEPLDC